MAKVKINLNGLNGVRQKVKDAVEEAINDVTDDLARTSSESAPHLEGILEQSFGKSIAWQGNKIIGVVDYSVKAENGYDYAVKMHEGRYNLGEKSQEKASSGGGVGMSGTAYQVGPRFLTRPLNGEAETYKNHVQSVIDDAVK